MSRYLFGETNESENPELYLSKQNASLEVLKRLNQIDYFSIAVSKKSRVEVLENLEKMCLNFEETFDRSPKPMIKKERFMVNPKKNLPVLSKRMEFIVSELKKRISSFPNRMSTYISPSRFKLKIQNNRSPGPGEFKTSSFVNVESHEFSAAPRLCSPITHNISKIESLYPDRKNQSEIKLNVKRSQEPTSLDFSGDRKGRISLLNVKLMSIKKKKKEIEKEKHEYYLQKFQKKIQLFELRMNKEEVHPVKKAWSVLIVVSGFCLTSLSKAKIKKYLRSRWEILLGRFALISRFLAKFMIKLKAKRRYIINQKLCRIAPAFDELFRVKILENKKLMQEFIDGYNSLSGLSKLMVKVKFCSVKLQRRIKNYLVIKQNRVNSLMIIWERLYQQYIREKPEKTAAYERLGPLPKDVAQIYIEKFIRGCVKNYYSDVAKFNQIDDEDKILPTLKIFSKQENLKAQIGHALKVKEHMIKKRRMQKYISKLTTSS